MMEANLLTFTLEENTIVEYANNLKLDDVPFLGEVMKKSLKLFRSLRKYIVFNCLHCGALGTSSQPLQRCTGCDLVTFCSANCRKQEWKYHKVLCKQFPVINGKNAYTHVIDCVGERQKNEYKMSLYNRSYIVQHQDPYLCYLFAFERICKICDDAISENLTDCKCYCVAYCSPTCKKLDHGHRKMCSSMKIIAEICSFLRNYEEKNIPSILRGNVNRTVQKLYKPLESLDNDLIHLSIQDAVGKNNKWVDALTGIMSERLAYPMAIFFVLQNLCHIPLKSEGLPFPKATSLTIHVAHRHPVLDSSVWEYFLHCLPELKQLNLVFVSPCMFLPEQTASLRSNVDLKLERCHDCAAQDRIINYSVVSMQYHNYSSCANYITPDVIVIYDAINEIQHILQGETNLDSLSLKNMIDNSNTLLVLVDSSKKCLIDTVECVSTVISPPLEIILKPQPNRLAGFNSNRQSDNIPEIVHVACLQKQRQI